MPILTFQAVPVDKMREYQQYEAFYREQHNKSSVDGGEGPEAINITYEDIGSASGAGKQLSSDEFREVEQLFKARYHGMARVILSIVRKAGGKMDQYQRLIYPNGQLGSSLYELVRYAIIPARSRSKGMPVDFTSFAKLLKDQNAPGYILAKVADFIVESNGNSEPLWLKYSGEQ